MLFSGLMRARAEGGGKGKRKEERKEGRFTSDDVKMGGFPKEAQKITK